jgi:hypothetical protein
MKNKIAVLLMETGVSYNKQKLHKVGYFRELLASNQDIDERLKPLLRLCRVERLMTIPAVGPDLGILAGGSWSGALDLHRSSV